MVFASQEAPPDYSSITKDEWVMIRDDVQNEAHEIFGELIGKLMARRSGHRREVHNLMIAVQLAVLRVGLETIPYDIVEQHPIMSKLYHEMLGALRDKRMRETASG